VSAPLPPPLIAYRRRGSAVSAEADQVTSAARDVLRAAERSEALFGKRAAALSELAELVSDCAVDDWDGQGAPPISPTAYQNAADLIRAWPEELPFPEFAPEPDGSISLDWIVARHRLASVSAGDSDRLALAWLEGTDRGHAVEHFDRKSVPALTVSRVISIADGQPSVRSA